MTKDELRQKLLESKRFVEMALASLDNEDFAKLDVRVAQVETKLAGSLDAIKAHRARQEILK